MSPALKGSSAIPRFECSDAIKICDGITFDFYMGLSHIHISVDLISGYGSADYNPDSASKQVT